MLDIKREAFGELGLHPWEYYQYTMEEFMLKREGHRKVKDEQWEHTRVIAFMSLKPHLKNQNTTIDHVFPKEGAKKKQIVNARELRERILAAAELSKN